MSRNSIGRFTFGELTIVGVILTVLAAIVVPRFSGAATERKIAQLELNVQAVRTSIVKYQAQHHGALPGSLNGEFDSTLFWQQLTFPTDERGRFVTSRGAAARITGPYLSGIPNNSLMPAPAGALPMVCDGQTDPPTERPGAQFYFNFADGTGKFWAAALPDGDAP